MRAPTTAPRARTGCDLQRIDDVTDAIRDFGDRYLDRVYTPVEQEAGRLGGAASLAARFAAKEAVLKLIGTADGVDPREVEIAHEDGRPEEMRRQWAAAVAMAKERGEAVLLCHSRRETRKALLELLPQLRREGIRAVTVEELLAAPARTAREH